MLKTLFRTLIFIWGSFSLSLYLWVFAPQSSVLIYFALPEQNSDIFAYDTSLHMRINLTNSTYPEWRGTWSETGTFAYTANASVRETASLFVSQNFALPRHIDSLSNQLIFGVTIALDGKHLLYISSEPANYSDIFLVDLLTDEDINLSQTETISESEPQWFGNEHLLFLREGNLYKMGIASQNSSLVIDGNFRIENILLSPDKQLIAFHGLEANERHLYIAQSDGSKLSHIPLGQSLSSEALSWSSDSQSLAFTLQDGSLNIYKISMQSLMVYPSAARRSSPLWSPDGRYIAFMESRRLYLLEWQNGTIHPVNEKWLIRPPLLWMP
jgi:Tol biopolymer transport system component